MQAIVSLYVLATIALVGTDSSVRGLRLYVALVLFAALAYLVVLLIERWNEDA